MIILIMKKWVISEVKNSRKFSVTHTNADVQNSEY